MYKVPIYIIGGEFYHHGIEGQKWGVRNGPPYPIDDGLKSNLFAKTYRKIMNLYEDRIEKSNKPIIKKAANMLDKEVNKYFDGKSGKIKNMVYTTHINLAEKVLYKKDFLQKEEEKDSINRRKKLLKYIILSNISSSSSQQYQQQYYYY